MISQRRVSIPRQSRERLRTSRVFLAAFCPSAPFTVAYFESASGLFRPVPARRYWPLSIMRDGWWSLLKMKAGPF
jgi:hypothetical protein